MIQQYAILDAEGRCIDRCLWDGETEWQAPEGCTVVLDPDCEYPIFVEPPTEPVDPLASLTEEQRQSLLAILQSVADPKT